MFAQLIILLFNFGIILAGKCPSGDVLYPCLCHSVSKTIDK